MFEVISVTKALADENRVRLLAALEGGELCVCELIDMINLAPSTVSKHLSILRSARLAEGRKSGRWMHYQLAQSRTPPAAGALDWLLDSIRDNPRIREDRRRLAEIKKMKKDAHCRMQKSKEN